MEEERSSDRIDDARLRKLLAVDGGADLAPHT